MSINKAYDWVECKSRTQISLQDVEILWVFWSSLFIQQYAEDFIVCHNLWHLWWFTKVKDYICILSVLLRCTPFSFFILLLIVFQEAPTSQAFVLTTDCWTNMVGKITLGCLFLTEYIVYLAWNDDMVQILINTTWYRTVWAML